MENPSLSLHLTENQRGILWLALPEQTSPVPLRFANPARHFHVTLAFNCWVDSRLLAAYEGQSVRVELLEECWDARVQALRVSLPPSFAYLCENQHPHMTLSMADGVRPVESNRMLAGMHHSVPTSVRDLELNLEFSPFS